MIWQNQAYAAGDFTASGAGTWTVGSGDVVNFSYSILGTMMMIDFDLETTSVTRSGGDPISLDITIPAGKSAAARTWTFPIYAIDNGTRVQGVAQILGGTTPTKINCYRFDVAQWATAVNTTYIFGQCIIEIQ